MLIFDNNRFGIFMYGRCTLAFAYCAYVNGHLRPAAVAIVVMPFLYIFVYPLSSYKLIVFMS